MPGTRGERVSLRRAALTVDGERGVQHHASVGSTIDQLIDSAGTFLSQLAA